MPLASNFNNREKRTFRKWLKTPAGMDLLRREDALLEGVLPGLFGYHMLWAGEAQYPCARGISPISGHARLSPATRHKAVSDLVLGEYTELPIQRDTLDVMVLTHILEYSSHPHAVLREAERALRPDGHIIILGFNPLSCYGACRAMMGFRGDAPWQGHYYHPIRIRDWLQLLGFGIRFIQYTAFAPPVQNQRIACRMQVFDKASRGIFAPFSGVYMIVARNLAVTPNVIKPKWKNKKTVLDGVAEPTTRVSSPTKRISDHHDG